MSIMLMVTRRSSRGPLYHVVDPSMPRIPDSYLDCVVYLYRSEVDAEDGVRAGGSGFLVGVQSKGLGIETVFLYVVSNKHVVQNAHVIRMNTKDGAKTVMPTKRTDWTDHPDGDDLSVCIISFDPNDFRFSFIPRETFITKQVIEEFNIGPGDDCFVVGRFVNHEGRQLNLPSVRFGNIAQMPLEPIEQDHGFYQESFLVEIKSLGGYSGSPILLQIPIFSNRYIEDWFPSAASIFTQTQTEFGAFKSHGPWLLGIDWGYLNDWTPVCGESGKPVNPNQKAMQVKLNTGMAAVIPAWKLAKLLDEGPLLEHRNSVVALQLAYRAKNPAIVTGD